MDPPPIEHVVMLALENRSFDHMLGYLDHSDPGFDNFVGRQVSNPGWQGAPAVDASPSGEVVLPLDPDHSHDAVIEQLGISGQRTIPWQPDNGGFVISLERKGRGLDPPRFTGLLAGIAARFAKRSTQAPIEGRGDLAMRCQPPSNVPVLSTLAKEFATFTWWFCSVPGETWPNRNFMHAATSDGETDIQLRPYTNRTIFELLEEDGRTWHIYHDDTLQLWAFERLWEPDRIGNWFPHDSFAEHVANECLPAYSFMEPNHRPVIHTLEHAPMIGSPDVSTSQHPGNNIVANGAYDSFDPQAPTDFRRGEELIAWLYETLRAKPAVLEKTILLITYDEHGGFYDHVPPETGVPALRWPPRMARAHLRLPAVPQGLDVRLHHAGSTRSGAPDLARHQRGQGGRGCPRPREHPRHVAGVVRARRLTAVEARRLDGTPPHRASIARHRAAAPSCRICPGMPHGHAPVLAAMQDPDGTSAATAQPAYLPDYYADNAAWAMSVAKTLRKRGTPAADADPAATTRSRGRPVRALTTGITNAFQDEARRQRALQTGHLARRVRLAA